MTEREIFDAALQLPDDESRVAYLRQACGSNLKLREHLEGLLRAQQLVGSFLESGAPPLIAQTIDMPAEPPTATAPGTQIGPYKLLQQIGAGGMGVVYMAEQSAPVRRKVALKIIKPGMDTHEVIARFEAERQALALMDHPNIARVFDGGATQAGRPYFVMELVRGVPLTHYCDENNLPVHERLELFVTVCHAVQHAHQKGIIHRDIKPSNVLVTLHDGRPVPKVIDFGVAKAIGQQLTDKTLFTQFAQMVGTPLYMSPEQAELTGLDIDTRGDIYSLGVLLYELLTGTTPFEGGRMKKAALDEIRRMIREEDPPSPSTRLSSTEGESQTAVAAHRRVDPRALSRLVRGDLDWIVMKALEKDRTRRYETANGFAADIVRYLSDEPVHACPPSAAYRLRKFARRNRGILATVVVVSLALVLGTTISTWQAIRAIHAEQSAQDHLEEETAARNDAETARNDAETARQDEAAQRVVAEQLEGQATRRLYDARLAQARAGSLSQRVGQRFDSLDAVAEAAHLVRDLKLPEERSLELRNAAIACLALPDLRLGTQWPGWPAGSLRIDFDGTLELYARSDTKGAVSVRRVADDQETAYIPGSGSDTYPVFSRDGKFLAVGSSAGLYVWKLGGPEPAAVVQVAAGDHFGLDFSPDCRQFAVGHADGSISFYDLVSGQLLRRLPPILPAKGHLAFSPDGRQLAVSSGASVKIRDLETGNVGACLQHPAASNRLAWHPDGKTLAVVCDDSRIYLWNVAHQEQLSVIEGLRSHGILIAFNHAGNLLASTGWEGKLRLWDPQTGRQLFSTMSGLSSLRFSPDDRLLTGDLRDGMLGLWEVAAGSEYRTLLRTMAAGKGKYFYGTPTTHSGGRLLAVGMQDGAALWDVVSGREVAFLNLEGATKVAFEPSGALLTNSSCGLFRWPVQFDSTTPEIMQLGPPSKLSVPGSIHEIACSHNGQAIASPQTDGALVLHSKRPDRPVRLGPHDDVRAVAISPNGQLVATGSFSGTLVRIWEAESGKLVKELSFDSGSQVSFSPDSKWLVTTAGRLRLWAVGTWEAGPNLGVCSGATCFSADGKLVAMETGTGIVRLVDPDTGREYARLEDPHQDRVVMCFTPDGTQLVTSSNDNQSVHIWDLRKIRGELTGLGWDWDLPAYSPAAWHELKPLQVHVESGELRSLIEAEYLRQQGNRFVQSREWDNAVGAFTKALEFEPQLANSWDGRGIAQFRLQHWDQAIADLSRALELGNGTGDQSSLCNFRGMAYSNLGRFAEALADAQRRLQFVPENSAAHNDLAWLLATCPEVKVRDAGGAVNHARRAVELAPQNGTCWNTLGAAQCRAGDLQAAIESLKRSMQLRAGGDSFDWFFLAMVHWRSDNKDEARTWYDKAVAWTEKNAKDNDELHRFRAEAREVLGIQDP